MKISQTAIKFFNKNLVKLKKYKQKYGNCNVPIDWPDQELVNWVEIQKKSKNRIPLEWVRQLKEIDFDFTYVAGNWDEMYLWLKDYKREHGDIKIDRDDLEYKRLFSWVQRQKRMKAYLSEKQIKKLEGLGLTWNKMLSKEGQWEERYNELREYKKRFGDCIVPKVWKENPVLSRWVQTQKRTEKEGKLSSERKKLLDKLGFIWTGENPKASINKMWENNFAALKLFKKDFGHIKVPDNDEYGTLYAWIEKQRSHFHKTKRLSEDQINRLEKLGIEWNPKEARWWEMFEKAKEISKMPKVNNHSRQSLLNSLNGWKNNCLRNKAKLTKDKIKALNSIGFDWGKEIRKLTTFEENYSKLEKFQKKHGHTNVRGKDDKKLSLWVITIRSKKDKLTKDKIRLLNKLGFNWNGLKKPWMEKYKDLCLFQKKYGHTRVPEDWKDRELHSFTKNLRNRKETLTKERIKLLDKIGFNWYERKINFKTWEERYEELRKFYKRFKHCEVPARWKENPALGAWVYKIRSNIIKTTKDKKKLLNDLGFEWKLPDGRTKKGRALKRDRK